MIGGESFLSHAAFSQGLPPEIRRAKREKPA
jgi:hypothetical protein